MIKIINNELIGQKVGPKENLISDDEYATDYEYITSFTGNLYLDKRVLDNDKTLDLYEELLLCLTINR